MDGPKGLFIKNIIIFRILFIQFDIIQYLSSKYFLMNEIYNFKLIYDVIINEVKEYILFKICHGLGNVV